MFEIGGDIHIGIVPESLAPAGHGVIYGVGRSQMGGKRALVERRERAGEQAYRVSPGNGRFPPNSGPFSGSLADLESGEPRI